MSSLDAALDLWRRGFNVVPAPLGEKRPRGSWKRWQSRRQSDQDVRNLFGTGDHNIFVITGAVSRLMVLDCDDDAALAYWRARIGGALDRTACVKTPRGYHFYFRLAPGQVERCRSSHGAGTGKWDIRAEGGGVIAPPSVQSSGRQYGWTGQ